MQKLLPHTTQRVQRYHRCSPTTTRASTSHELYKKGMDIDLITVTDQLIRLKALPTAKDDKILEKQKQKKEMAENVSRHKIDIKI